MSHYVRTREQAAHDFAAAKEFEQQVAERLGRWVHTRFDSTVDLDVWWPGFFVDVKEKKQPLTPRWHLLEGVPERDLFVLDELSIRKALEKYPAAYFLIRDVPGGDRLFLASVGHVVTADRVRRQRKGKGKWIVNLAQFRRLGRVEDAPEIIQAELVAMPWKASECLALDTEPPQI